MMTNRTNATRGQDAAFAAAASTGYQTGLTKRELLAALMTAAVLTDTESSVVGAARSGVEAADALIAELNGEGGDGLPDRPRPPANVHVVTIEDRAGETLETIVCADERAAHRAAWNALTIIDGCADCHPTTLDLPSPYAYSLGQNVARIEAATVIG